MTRAVHFAKKVLPFGSIRNHLVEFHNGRKLEQGLRRLRQDPWCVLDKNDKVLEYLLQGWGNADWAADGDYLRACVEQCRATEGPVLECGSGLSTLIVGAIAQAMSRELWALEHIEFWGAKVQHHLHALDMRNVHLCIKPLKEYGEYSWYDPPLDAMPSNFGLVICDGPPGGVHGGRYGFLPVMKKRIAPKMMILLDDTVREDERTIARRWAESLNARLEFFEGRAFVAIRTG